MKYTPENCEKLARDIAESMEIEDLIQYVVDDLYDVFMEDRDSFELNVESTGDGNE